MKKITYFCDICKEECSDCIFPSVAYRVVHEVDGKGKESTFVNLIDLCNKCVRDFLRDILCGRGAVMDIRSHFDDETCMRVQDVPTNQS